MSHQVQANLTDLAALAAAVKELTHYTTAGGYVVHDVTVEDGRAVWHLTPVPKREQAPKPQVPVQRRRLVEPGDRVIVETKGQQVARRVGGGDSPGVEGTVFRVLTRGPHPHGMKVELRDRTVGRVMRNLTEPGAGEALGTAR